MSVAENQLLRDTVHYIVRGKAATLLLHGGMEHHLKQNVSQLLLHIGRAVAVNGVQRLVGLL